MNLEAAPLFTDIAPGPAGGVAYWAETSDEKRIRVAHWSPQGAKGTVLLFPGRTEYIEKYGVTAGALAERGLAVMTIDWRGQGLADRLIDDPNIGYVEKFTDYQKDVAAMLRAARELGLPRPYFLLAHSMGGCIGLRAVMEGMPVQAAAFSGPMWGIQLEPVRKLAAQVLSKLMPAIGKGEMLAPGTRPEPYVSFEPFAGNMLTTDQPMYEMMKAQLQAHPELSLGGPSYQWLREAIEETNHLASRAAPSLPCVTWVGSNERIVNVPRIHERMESWKGGRLDVVEDGEHEVLMEKPHMRTPVFDALEKLFLGTVTT